jgi:hypothetical protein
VRAAESQKSDRDSHESGALTPKEGGEASTLGEALGKERELREEQRSLAPNAPWEDAHTQREDKQRAEELRQKQDRVQKKDDGQKAGGQQAGPHAGQAGKAPPRTGQQGARPLAGPPGGSGFDGFEGLRGNATARAAGPALSTPPLGGAPIAPALPARLGGGAIHMLNNAKAPGVYFREEGRDDGHTEEDEDPELAAAVEEAIRLLFGVRGIHRIGPGQDEAGTPVIVITTSRGFSHVALRAVPERVHRFKTLLAVPYELLPLRREIS